MVILRRHVVFYICFINIYYCVLVEVGIRIALETYISMPLIQDMDHLTTKLALMHILKEINIKRIKYE